MPPPLVRSPFPHPTPAFEPDSPTRAMQTTPPDTSAETAHTPRHVPNSDLRMAWTSVLLDFVDDVFQRFSGAEAAQVVEEELHGAQMRVVGVIRGVRREEDVLEFPQRMLARQ